ncbi:GGDEF domain-containing response regulator [Glycomyces salinus]|uniref:GGDEF domain-containing response regulator n=1 Tax=Glycomyces salinus TaxID=980294 RepID=UPI0018EA9163|nr:diguanylate cyclase [Glycomyces salinus]
MSPSSSPPSPRNRPGGGPNSPPELVLIADSDPEMAEFLAARLRADGFDTALARDGYQALAGIALRRPGIVLLEADLPFIDGLALTRQLRADPATASLPIILLCARPTSADKIAGLKAGADDYVAKPFDPAEVSARIDSAIRRHREVRESSPLTGMPGNDRILRELNSWIKRGHPFALCYIDIDHFKAVNDVYGFVRGDEFIKGLAECVYAAAGDAGAAPVFLGHVGGDDFTILCAPEHAKAVTGFLNDHFAVRVRELCDPLDVERGYIEHADRDRRVTRSRLPTLSIGVALSTRRRFTDAYEAVAEATALKSVAKSHSGPFVAFAEGRPPGSGRRPVFWSPEPAE